MNKTSLSAALVAACCIVALASSPVAAADGTLTFRGQIDSVTCDITGGAGTNGGTGDITGGAGTNGGTGDITVNLPTVGVNALAAANQTAGSTPFTLTIGGAGATACTNGKIASLVFESAASPLVNPTTGNLKNASGAGYATNVEVGLRNAGNQPINLYTGANTPTAEIQANTATLNFIAQYVAVGSAATNGLVNTSVEYSVTYN